MCGNFAQTRLTEAPSYLTAVGLRWEFSRHAFVRVALVEQSLNVDSTYGTPYVTSYRVEIGSY